jgi:hypothetical protein
MPGLRHNAGALQGTGWIEERVMSVLAEAQWQGLGAGTRGDHLLPLLLYGIQAILDSPENTERAHIELESYSDPCELTEYSSEARDLWASEAT